MTLSAPRHRSRRYRAVPLPGRPGMFEFHPVDEEEDSPARLLEPRPVGRSGPVPRAPVSQRAGLTDEVNVLIGDIAIRLSRELASALPHEVTVVIPRVDVRRRFQDGKLVEMDVEYAGITVSHSPRFPPKRL